MQSKRLLSLAALVGSFGLSAFLIILALSHAAFPIAFSIVAALGGLYFYLQYDRTGEQWKRLAQQRDYFERGIARLTDDWQGNGVDGLDFAREGHLYQSDLNVLGKGSLFELLCTTRSQVGAERLASYLLDSVGQEEATLRQEAVKELRDETALREEIFRLGKYRLQDCSGESFKDWLNLPRLAVPRAVSILVLISSSATLLLGLGIFARIFLWSQWIPLLALLVAIQLGVAGALLRKTRPQIAKLRLLADALPLLRHGVALMQRQRFNSPKLSALVRRVSARDASFQIRKVERLILAFDQREKPQFLYLSMLLAAGTQLALAVDRWRSQYQEDFIGWLDAWAEFEALNALAGYAYEQPGCVFPELAEGASTFEAKQLGHPLLPVDVCVGNDVLLNHRSRLYLVSGSNMAGKSTFLRAIGLNTVVALAGGPVRASSARLSCFTVCASLAITDSLADGRSKFMAEVERIKNMIACTETGRPVLFLIDEILSGTNSEDRRIAAEAVVKALLTGGAVGALSIHDLALAEIADDTAGGVLVCMESSCADSPLKFDYRLKPGVARQSSALAIVRMMGISVADD
ncbi:MAG TPA: hypothetical protein VMU57_20940 [Edaphobacter sp.]|uniref:MutS-related protein n=1 Tax=Edaphobacter sp. TaxID=1934404 RepID=UPI002BE64F51|nr:hypothetical protein [Edaphobacter sp.]HUZ97378.1 hypothetical protein [Edaphobacter sp.]